MKTYLVAATGDTLGSKVSGRFGHATAFLIIDPQTMDFEAFPGIQADESGQTIKRLITRDIKKVVVGNIGPSSFYEIRSLGCTIYLCRNMVVGEAVGKVESGDIEPLANPTLKDSIHSARRKGGNTYGMRGTGRGMGRGMGNRRGGGG